MHWNFLQGKLIQKCYALVPIQFLSDSFSEVKWRGIHRQALTGESNFTGEEVTGYSQACILYGDLHSDDSSRWLKFCLPVLGSQVQQVAKHGICSCVFQLPQRIEHLSRCRAEALEASVVKMVTDDL